MGNSHFAQSWNFYAVISYTRTGKEIIAFRKDDNNVK